MDPILSALDREFFMLDARSRDLIRLLRDDELFRKPHGTDASMTMCSCGEYILRSAAMIEMAFGGITTRLWDDPFEWTLPEHLSGGTDVMRYLDEVETTRQRGFTFFNADTDLSREIPAPQEQRPLADILLDALGKAYHYQGRAYAVYQMVSTGRLPRL